MTDNTGARIDLRPIKPAPHRHTTMRPFFAPKAKLDRSRNGRYTSDMPKRSSKQKDTQQIARHVLDAVVPDAEPPKPEKKKNPAAVALGRLGGKVGGKARAAKLTPEQRKEIAQKAARKRWGKV